MESILRAHAEQQYAEELHELEKSDTRQRPVNWRLSPWAVATYLLGGTLDNGFEITPKYIGNGRLIEIAIATLTTDRVSQGICNAKPGVFMHGPTFMANPLACSAALASINLLLASPWQEQVQHIEDQLKQLLAPTLAYDHVADVRVLGGIGVIETQRPVKMQEITAAFVNAGIWVRPFGKLVYLMPPFVIEDADLTLLANGLVKVLADESLLMN